MASDPTLASNLGRVEHEAEIDLALSSWCAQNDSESILNALDESRVPGGPIYNVEDMINDEHFNARELFETVEINGQPLKIPAILPKLTKTPGATRWPGPKLGEHNEEVFGELLGLSSEAITKLSDSGVI
jgi:crotonobetainyl-CoA:carnitine CoA-transferase CaiB-like acyl-CoA transferase